MHRATGNGLRRAYETRSTGEYLPDELKNICSNIINNYPQYIISTMFKEIKSKQDYQGNISQNNNYEDQKHHVLVLPEKGHKGQQVVNLDGEHNEKAVKYSLRKECKNKRLLYW